MKLVHPKHGIVVTVDNRHDETRLRALGYRNAPEAPKAQPQLPVHVVVTEEAPETPDEAPKRRTRSPKSE